MKKFFVTLSLISGIIVYYISAMWLTGFFTLANERNLFSLVFRDILDTIGFKKAIGFESAVNLDNLIDLMFSNPKNALSVVFRSVSSFLTFFLYATLFLLLLFLVYSSFKLFKKKKQVIIKEEEKIAKNDQIHNNNVPLLIEKKYIDTKENNSLILGLLPFKTKKKSTSVTENKIISLADDSILNKNVLVLGSTGTRKSRAFIRPNIVNIAKNRNSIILTDPKSELFEDTSEYMKDLGYNVKVLNLSDLKHSNKWNPISEINSEIDALYLANIIISNTKDINHDKLWVQSELYLLKSLIIYVKKYLPKKEQNMQSIYKLIASSNPKKLESIFSTVPNHKSCKIAFNLFSQNTEDYKKNILVSLIGKLQIFNIEEVRTLTSTSDFTLDEPKKKPCIYYCILPDAHTSLNLITSIFFSLMFLKLSTTHDLTEDYSIKNREVYLLLDEFANIGEIPDLKKRLSNIRSRKIHCNILLQSINQLKEIYPEDKWREILSYFDTSLYFGSTDESTNQYVVDSIGKTKVDDENKNIINLAYLENFDHDKIIVNLRGQYPIKVNKLDWSNMSEHEHISKNKKSISTFIPESLVVDDYISIEESTQPNSIDEITDNSKFRLINHQLFKQLKSLRYMLPDNLIVSSETITVSNPNVVNKQMQHLVDKIKESEEKK